MASLTAVVIDDDKDLGLMISTALVERGFTVHLAESGPEGVEAARKHKAALVTTEIDLPGFDGLEVIRRVRTFSNAPIMIVSTDNAIRDIEVSLVAGADGYLAKPVRPAVLQAYAEALLRRPA